MKKILFLMLLSIFFLYCSEIGNDTKIEFDGLLLKQAILIELGEIERPPELRDISYYNSKEYELETKKMNSDIYKSQVKDLTQLKANGVENLKGIEYCEKLEKLDLDYAIFIADISPLKYLPSLKELKMANLTNKDFKYDGLSELKSLETLYLCFKANWIENLDLNLISNLTHLKTIILDSFGITDITPLLTLHKNGGLKKGSYVSVINNDLDLRPGTPNREVVDKLIEAGVEVFYRDGNIIE